MSQPLKRLHNYPSGSAVQRKTGHVYCKGQDGKWHPRGRVKMQKLYKEDLTDARVFHMDGNPANDHQDNLAVVRFCGTRYRLAFSRPIFIPLEVAREREKVKA